MKYNRKIIKTNENSVLYANKYWFVINQWKSTGRRSRLLYFRSYTPKKGLYTISWEMQK